VPNKFTISPDIDSDFLPSLVFVVMDPRPFERNTKKYASG